MRVRIFQPQYYVRVAVLRMGYAEAIFMQPDEKLDTMWRCLTKTSYVATGNQVEMWPLI